MSRRLEFILSVVIFICLLAAVFAGLSSEGSQAKAIEAGTFVQAEVSTQAVVQELEQEAVTPTDKVEEVVVEELAQEVVIPADKVEDVPTEETVPEPEIETVEIVSPYTSGQCVISVSIEGSGTADIVIYALGAEVFEVTGNTQIFTTADPGYENLVNHYLNVHTGEFEVVYFENSCVDL